MFSDQDVAKFNEIKANAETAAISRENFLQSLREMCDHSFTVEDAWGGEDTLGNWSPDKCTHAWHCALCGDRIAIHKGEMPAHSSLPKDHPAHQAHHLPEGISSDILKHGMQRTRADLDKAIEEELAFIVKVNERKKNLRR